MLRYWLSYLATIVLAAFLFAFLFWYFTPDKDKNIQLTAPVPKFLSLTSNSQVRLLDLWFPKFNQVLASTLPIPNLTAKSGVVYDMTANKTLFEREPEQKLPMASLTKIMTAIISLENRRADNKYTVSEENLVGEDSMGLSSGEILTQEELLYGLLLNSGNDAAEVLAANYPNGGRKAFIEAMNDKVVALGLTNTHFTNPSGLQGDGNQYTTAYDLLVITKYAIDNFPLFTNVTSTIEKQLPSTVTHKAYDIFNETNLVSSYPGVKGIKTGYTPEAGLCLVTYLDYGGHKIIGILLNSENRRGEMKELLDYSLITLGITPPQLRVVE